MCRNIKTLFNFEPPATEDEVHASALQFVRKLSGFNKPSQANAEAFERAVSEVSQAARTLLVSLHRQLPRAIAPWRRRRREPGHASGLRRRRSSAAIAVQGSPLTRRISISLRSRQRRRSSMLRPAASSVTPSMIAFWVFASSLGAPRSSIQLWFAGPR